MTRKHTLIAAFAAVYLVWGSTYLAIRYAIATLPPWTLSAARFFAAAAVMALIARLKGEARLTREEVQTAGLSGALLVTANGAVCVAEQWVPSGITAVIVGGTPFWIMLLSWVAFHGDRPTLRRITGAAVGLMGITVIASADSLAAPAGGGMGWGPLILLGTSLLWAGGTLLQRRMHAIRSPTRFAAWQMALGALAAFVMSLTTEQPWRLQLSHVSASSWCALAYLVVFGSVIAFTAYGWLSRNVEPHLVSTYAFVNPVIAVTLGALFFDEPVTAKFALGTAMAVAGLLGLMWPTKPTLQASAAAKSLAS